MLTNRQRSSKSAIAVAPAEHPGIAAWLWRDPVLSGLIPGAGLLVLYQLATTWLHPPWLGASTDWLLAVLAWPEAAIPALASVWLRRARRPAALAWAMVSLAMLAYALSQTLRLVFDQYLLPGRVPSPWWPDLFYLLQYPFFFLALVCVPGVSRLGQTGISRVKVLLDSLLLAMAGTALSWYFVLAPIYNRSAESGLGKAADLAAPIGDLALLFGLIFVFTRQRSDYAVRMALRLLIVVVILGIIADFWYAYSNLYGTFQAGSLLDAFMLASDLLIPLAALVHVRLTQRGAAGTVEGASRAEASQPGQAQNMPGTLHILFPFAAALLASGLIVLRAIQVPSNETGLIVALLVSSGLLMLVMVRQGITTLENQQLRREQEAARASELAM